MLCSVHEHEAVRHLCLTHSWLQERLWKRAAAKALAKEAAAFDQKQLRSTKQVCLGCGACDLKGCDRCTVGRVPSGCTGLYSSQESDAEHRACS